MSQAPQSVCIIGGGIAGFSVAVNLRSHGFRGPITIFEKNGSPGGRLLSRQGRAAGNMFDLGAGRFSARRHPEVRDLCSMLSLELEPFRYKVHYKIEGEHGARSDRTSLRSLVKETTEILSNEPNQNLCFSVACKKAFGEDTFERLRTISGYDTLGHPALPISGGLAILLHHPETECLVDGKMDGWYRVKNGFQSLVHRIEALASGMDITIKYDHVIRDMTNVDESTIEVSFDAPTGPECKTFHTVVFACPPRDADKVLSRSRHWGNRLPRSLVEVPVTKAFFEFNRPWWNDYGIRNACVISNSPARKVYLSDEKSLAWFMCDGASALESYHRLTLPLFSPAHFLELHLGSSLPEDATLLNFDVKFWKSAVSFYPENTDSSTPFLKLSDNVLLCSDACTDLMGWVEGSLVSARAVSDYICGNEAVFPDLLRAVG